MILALAEVLSQNPSLVDIAGLLTAMGIGGIAVKLIDVRASSGTRAAQEENIAVDTQAMLSELIETSTATLRQSVEDQKRTISRQRTRIEALESMLSQLKEELDESVLIQRLRDAEHDNIYLRGRVKTLLGRTEALRMENDRLIAELNKD